MANWEISIPIRWICWQGKEGRVSKALCLLEGIALMGRHERVPGGVMFTFFFCTRVLFSSQVGFLWLFKIIWRFRPGIFVFRAVGRMRGWRGLSWCWEGLLSKKKKKRKVNYAYVRWQKWKPVSSFVFFVLILIPFLRDGSRLSGRGNHGDATSSATSFLLVMRRQAHFNAQLSSEVLAADCFERKDFQVPWLLAISPFLLASLPCFNMGFPCHLFFFPPVQGISSCSRSYRLFTTGGCKVTNHLSMINGLQLYFLFYCGITI